LPIGHAPLPVDTPNARHYLVGLARDGREMAIIQRRLTALAATHTCAGYWAPATGWD